MPFLDRPAVRDIGVAVTALGVLGTFGAQLAMGGSCRTTVDPTERPALVTGGVIRIVRNPAYTTVIGLALTVPNPIALVGVATVIVGSELQVWLVEEPYLHGVHDAAYRDYTARAAAVRCHQIKTGGVRREGRRCWPAAETGGRRGTKSDTFRRVAAGVPER